MRSTMRINSKCLGSVKPRCLAIFEQGDGINEKDSQESFRCSFSCDEFDEQAAAAAH